MGVLRFPGLATGIDTAALIEQLMIINSRRLATYQVQKTDYEAQTTALSELRTKVSALETSASALADADNMEIFKATSSDTDVLTVTASSEANPGSHSIEINQLATTETWIQDTSTFDYETDYVGGGTFIYSYNNQERLITAVAGETTLEDLVGLINNDDNNPGVTASLLYQGDKYHLMLSGQETGEDYQISINTSSTEVWKPNTALSDHTFTDDGGNAGLSTKITELDQFSGTLVGDEKIIISGKNHPGSDLPDKELSITANTTVGYLIDAINEQFDGVATARLENGQIWLTDNTCGSSSLEISLAYDNGTGGTTLGLPTMAVSTEGGSTSESLASLTSTSFIQTQNAQSSYIKVDGYPASANGELQTLTLDQNASSGHFHLTYNGQTTAEIVHNAVPATIQAELEALSNVSPGDIVVGGTRLSQAGDTTFQFLATAGDVSMISIDASALVGPTTCAFVETTKGSDGWIHRNSNSITDALTGITLNLHDVTEPATPIKISISRNTGLISARINGMVSAYNELIAELKTKTEYDSESQEMGILSNDIAVSFIKTQARNSFIGIIDGFIDTIDSFVQASDIGITIDGAGIMEFDTDEFNDAVNEDFTGVLELLGATKSGNSDSTIIQFYSASDKYTTAGTYDIEVDINDSNQITDVRIKLSSESTWRDDVAWPDNLVTGNSDFDDNGNPLYPENGLQFTVDPNQPEGTYTATINVKQGMAGALEDLLDEILEADGRLDISKGILDDRITAMDRRIENEENRLNNVETRLIDKFARLEKTLAMMQQQMSAVSMVSAV
ncbi:MAG: flagellar filament capping protein FliD, partial [Planctomycetota bacterium]